MDCKTARLLLEYARPSSAELDPTEAGVLDEHLSSCESCDQLARTERRADEVVGKAMRQVDVPDQLRARILSRMKQERIEPRRRWIAYGMCGTAAAALLLLGLGAWHWLAVRPAFPATQLLVDAQTPAVVPLTSDKVKAAFAGQGVETEPPTDLDYKLLRWMFLTDVRGRQTPTLLFNLDRNNDRGPNGQRLPAQHALVFIVSDSQFDVKALPQKPEAGTDYEYKCDIRHGHGDAFGYVIYYTGDNLGWLDRPIDPPPTVGDGN